MKRRSGAKSTCPAALRAFLQRDAASLTYVVRVKRERNELRKSNMLLTRRLEQALAEKKRVSDEFERLVRFPKSAKSDDRRRELAASLHEYVVRRHERTPHSALSHRRHHARSFSLSSPIVEEKVAVGVVVVEEEEDVGDEAEVSAQRWEVRVEGEDDAAAEDSDAPPLAPPCASLFSVASTAAAAAQSRPTRRAAPLKPPPIQRAQARPRGRAEGAALRPPPTLRRGSRRSAASRVNYAEPSLSIKLRRGMLLSSISYAVTPLPAPPAALRPPTPPTASAIASEPATPLASPRAPAPAPTPAPSPSPSASSIGSTHSPVVTSPPVPRARRSGRQLAASRVNYAEPSLRVKLRRGMRHSSISYSATPQPMSTTVATPAALDSADAAFRAALRASPNAAAPLRSLLSAAPRWMR